MNVRPSPCAWLTIKLAAWLIVALESSWVGQATPQVRFGSPTDFAVGSAPDGVVAGDFNQDGKPDIATANYGSNSVTVLLGVGDGTFTARTDYAVAFRPTSLAVGDFNNDTKLDIITVGWTNTSVLLSSSTGGFFVSNFTNNFSSSPSIAVADFNKDGKVDIASNLGRFALGNGDGSFSATSNYYAGTGGGGVSAGDVNGDGSLDLVFSGYYSGKGSFQIITNKGNGTFSTPVYYGSVSSSGNPVLNDINGDGRLDIVVLSGSYAIVRTNAGGGNFGATNLIDTGIGSFDLERGDFNGDGKMDLVVRGGGFLKPLPGNGDGSFTLGIAVPVQAAAAGSPRRTIAVGDFDGDSRPDIAVVTSSNTVSVLLNQTPPELKIERVAGHVQITCWRPSGQASSSKPRPTSPLLIAGSRSHTRQF